MLILYYFFYFSEILYYFSEILYYFSEILAYFSELLAFPLKLLPARADSQFWQSFSEAV